MAEKNKDKKKRLAVEFLENHSNPDTDKILAAGQLAWSRQCNQWVPKKYAGTAFKKLPVFLNELREAQKLKRSKESKPAMAEEEEDDVSGGVLSTFTDLHQRWHAYHTQHNYYFCPIAGRGRGRGRGRG